MQNASVKNGRPRSPTLPLTKSILSARAWGDYRKEKIVGHLYIKYTIFSFPNNWVHNHAPTISTSLERGILVWMDTLDRLFYGIVVF